MRKYVRLIVPMLVVVAALAVACGGGDSKTVKIPGGGEVSTSNKLPSDFPSDFPIYGGAKVVGSIKGDQQGLKGFFVTWETGDDVDKVTAFYKKEFEKGPWKSESTLESSGTTILGAKKEGKTAALTIARSDNKTTIGAFLGDDDSSSDSSTPSGGSKTSTSSGSSSKKTSTPSSDSSDSGDSESTPVPNTKLPAEVKISKDFPADRVPFPKGARVTSSSSFGGAGSKTYAVELYVKDTPENVGSFFSDELPKHSWTSGFSSESNGEYVETFSGAENATTTEGVTISAAVADDVTGGYTKVSIIVSSSGN